MSDSKTPDDQRKYWDGEKWVSTTKNFTAPDNVPSYFVNENTTESARVNRDDDKPK